MLAYFVQILFTTYTFLLLARIFGSWFPSFADSPVMRFVAFYTDPYLNIFRQIIPPLGMVDISPIFAFIALQMLEYLVLSLIY
jgi:YggT family protein